MANLTFKSIGETQVSLNKIGSPYTTTVQYSKNNGAWTTVQLGTAIQLANNDTLAFSGGAKFSKNIQNRYNFSTAGTGTLTLSGDLVSLVSSSTVEDYYQFNSLFSGCANIVDASNLTLPSNTTKWCYANMFLECSNLSSAPTLPATTLAQWCYSSMFTHCTSLSSAPTLPAITLANYCYYCMFYGCKNLTSAPALPAQELADWCYNSMFYDCQKLSSIQCQFRTWQQPENATTNWVTNVAQSGVFHRTHFLSIEHGVDNIPSGWSTDCAKQALTFVSTLGSMRLALNQKNSPNAIDMKYKIDNGAWSNYTIGQILDLPVDSYVSFSGANDHFSKDRSNRYYFTFGSGNDIEAYGNVQSLLNFSDTVPDDAFIWLFGDGGFRLTKAPQLLATTVGHESYFQMFYRSHITQAPNLPATGFTGAGSYFQMFMENHYLTTPPSTLPATNLITGCYMYMFQDCQNLSASPYLPATTLVHECYQGMFSGCTNLSSINVEFTNWEGVRIKPSWDPNSTTNWVLGVQTNGGTFTKPTALSTAYGNTYIPTNWTVVNK